MALTYKEKQFITLNYPQKNIIYIAEKLKKSVSEVEAYIDSRLDQNADVENSKKIKLSSRFENIIYFVILSVVVVLVYFRSFNNELVSDDREVIIDLERYLKSGEFLWRDKFSIFRNLQYVFAYQLAGLTPFFYRIFNILFHIGFSFLTFLVMKRFTKEKHLPFIVALFVAVHPIMVESIAWISGGVYPQSGFFTLLSFYFYIRYKEVNSKIFLAFSILSFLIAPSISEKVVVFPLILTFYEFLFGNLKKNFKTLMVFYMITAVWLFLYSGRLSARLDYLMLANGTDQRYNFTNPFIQVPAALTSYFHLFIWPDSLSLYQSDISITPFTILRNSLVTMLYFGLIFYFYKKNRFIFFWLSFFFISLLVTLNPFGLSWVFAERYAYFGSIGIYFFLVYAIFGLFKFLNARSVAYVFLTFVIIALSIRTFIRIGDWKNEETLWTATAKYSKTDAKSHNNLGHVLAKKGDVKGAAESFQRAITLSPGYADPYHNLANIYLQMGDMDQAEQIFLKALELNPNLWQSNQNLASIHLQRKEFAEAANYFEKVKKIKPDYAGSYMGLGMIALENKNVSQSIAMFNKVLELDPENTQAKSLLLQAQAIQ